MSIQTGYAIADITAIKALTPSQRVDGYTRQAQSDPSGNPAWYTFLASSTASPDDDLVLLPIDNPANGRWHKNGGASGGASFGGATICNSSCDIGGKAFEFYAAHTNLELIIEIGFDISITSGSTSIQIHRWSQEPNTSLTGRQFVAAVASAGGKVTVALDSTYRWISIFAKNPSKSGQYDGVCFVINGNVITLIGFS